MIPQLPWIRWGFVSFQVLATCCELDLIRFVQKAADKGRTFEEIVDYLQFPPHSVRVLLLACCANGLFSRNEQGHYIDNLHLNDTTYEQLQAQIDFTRRVTYHAFAHLTESLRQGKNLGVTVLPEPGETIYERLANHPEAETRFQQHMTHAVRSIRTPLFKQAIGPRQDRIRYAVDVGSGAGELARMIVNEFPAIKMTIFDLPTVDQRAVQRIEDWGLTDKITVHPGDMFQDPYPPEIDTIIYSAVLPIFSEEKILFLLNKAYQTLPAGGQLLIQTMACHDDETGPFPAATMSLYFTILASGEGMAYPSHNYERWLTDAGFKAIELIRHPQRQAMVLIAATKEG